MKRKIMTIVLALCVIACLICTGCAKETPFTYQDARNGVARISCMVRADDGTALVGGRGSGFFVGAEGKDPQYFITNYHVVEDYLKCGSGEWVQMSLSEENVVYVKAYLDIYFDSNDSVEAYVVAANENADVAILRLDAPTDKRISLALLEPTNEMVGQTVYGIGFPGLSDNAALDAVSESGLNDVTVTSGTISRLLTSSGSGIRRIQTDMVIQHGNSGGPMVNAQGQVLGINSWTVGNSDAELNYYACNIAEAIQLLNQNGIPYTSAAEDSTDSGGLWLYVAIGAAVAAVVIALAVVLTRKKAAPKQSPQPEPQPVPGPVTNPEDSGYRIQCTGGALAGQRIMLRKADTLILGRNPAQCNVVFPDTPGISAKHCAVWYDSGKIYLKDLGSTHGTFVMPGTKLASEQTVELRVGDSFYLGSQQELFVIAQKRGS